MTVPAPAKKIVVTVAEDARWQGHSAWHALVDLFSRSGLWGTTATRALAGSLGDGPLRTLNVLDLSASLPVRVEAWGPAEAVDAVLPEVYDVVEKGVVEVQETRAALLGAPAPSTGRKEETVRLVGKAKLLQIHVGSHDRVGDEALHEAIVRKARQLDLAGATVYRGVLGYGAHRRLHRHRPIAPSDDPILVTVVDEEAKVEKLLAAIDPLLTGGCLVTLSDVSVVKYLPHDVAPEGAPPPETAEDPG